MADTLQQRQDLFGEPEFEQRIMTRHHLGFATAIILFAGWALNDTRIMRAGLLLAVVMWTFTAWIAAVGLGALTSFLLALAWTVLAAGSYFMEEVEAHAVKERGRDA